MLREYYRRRREIARKYSDMLCALKGEEVEETRCAALNKSGKVQDLQAVMEEIHAEYTRTENLLLQQKIVEEEELVNSYRDVSRPSAT